MMRRCGISMKVAEVAKGKKEQAQKKEEEKVRRMVKGMDGGVMGEIRTRKTTAKRRRERGEGR